VHHLPREVLWNRNCHHTSTKFQLRVIRWVHELCKWPSYNSNITAGRTSLVSGLLEYHLSGKMYIQFRHSCRMSLVTGCLLPCTPCTGEVYMIHWVLFIAESYHTYLFFQYQYSLGIHSLQFIIVLQYSRCFIPICYPSVVSIDVNTFR
jgi:hypothetical protein